MRFGLIAVGGAMGALARYCLVVALAQRYGGGFPLGTLVVNVLGCLVIGVLGGIWELRVALADELRLFLFSGLLGGFTTYSAFGQETFVLLRQGQVATAVVSVVASLVLGIGAVWAGRAAALALL